MLAHDVPSFMRRLVVSEFDVRFNRIYRAPRETRLPSLFEDLVFRMDHEMLWAHLLKKGTKRLVTRIQYLNFCSGRNLWKQALESKHIAILGGISLPCFYSPDAETDL